MITAADLAILFTRRKGLSTIAPTIYGVLTPVSKVQERRWCVDSQLKPKPGIGPLCLICRISPRLWPTSSFMLIVQCCEGDTGHVSHTNVHSTPEAPMKGGEYRINGCTFKHWLYKTEYNRHPKPLSSVASTTLHGSSLQGSYVNAYVYCLSRMIVLYGVQYTERVQGPHESRSLD